MIARPGTRVAAEAVLALLLLVQVGRMAIDLASRPSAPPPAPGEASAPEVDLSVLSRFDPFSPPSLDAAEPGSDGTAGALRLFGVQVDGDRSFAIVAGSDGRQVTVGLGEPVEAGLVLKSVGPDHAVLLRDSRPVRLTLGEAMAAGQQTSGPGSPPSGQRAISPAQPPPPGVPAGAGRSAGIGSIPVRPAAAPAARPDPAALIAGTTFTPRIRGLGVNGVTVTSRDDGTALRAVGLQSGDVILSVNGVSLNSLDAVRSVGRQINSGSADIRYQRGDEVRTARLGTGS